MRFVSFNANGIRARLHQLAAIRDRHAPDVLALQEIKVADEEFPVDEVRALGFEHLHYFGQKGHYGVALLSRHAPERVETGFPWRGPEEQRRFISATCRIGAQRVTILNAYFPQGDNRERPTKFAGKRTFYADMTRYLEAHCDPDDLLLLAGDMNVAPDDADIGIGDENRKRWLRTGKCCFLPEERDWLRIDLILGTDALAARVADCGIDYEIRGLGRPSDHCPIWCQVDL